MKKILLFLIVFTSFSATINAQDAKLTLKEERAFDLLKATLFTANKFGPVYLDHHDYNFQRDQNGDLLITATSASGVTNQLIGDKYDHYKISNRNGVPYLIEMNNECERKGFIRIDKWEGDKIPRSASRGLKSGVIVYDSNNKIVAIDLGQSYKKSGKKKVYTNNLLSFKYNTNGQLSELAKESIVHKKSSSSKNLKKDYSYKQYDVKISYGNEEVTLVKDVFRTVKGKSKKSSHVEHKLSRKDSQTNEMKKSTSFNKKGIKETTIETIQNYDQKLRLIKSQNKSDHYTTIIEYTYDDMNNILTENKQVTNKKKEITEERTSNTYNETGLLEKSIKEKIKDEKLDKKIVTEYTYQPEKEGEEITKCQNKKDFLSKFYNVANELYQETIPNKIRVKENGVWGEWKFFRM